MGGSNNFEHLLKGAFAVLFNAYKRGIESLSNTLSPSLILEQNLTF